ncbi:MAG: 3-hydroxyacyl-CoA dehydrogenase family protein [Bacteroidetes bacterium]|nr:3-hydroxyacyl-CoA dehydrogenase family protein [Bacteroidota bacterium]
MNYTDRLENVSVLGAAGKMGSGILLLTAIEMADLSLKPENKGKHFVINAIDVSSEALFGLMKYIRAQVFKAAEKKIIALRAVYHHRADLIENSEIINQYVDDVMLIIRPSIHIEVAYHSGLIFEAIKEDPALKTRIFSQINENSSKQPWFFTNTSSIPINELDKNAKLNGRVLGVHFYNPPAVQKLVEIIKTDNTQDELNEFALQFSKNLRKTVVPSHDFAGFIGNGHFMRDALHGIKEAEKLTANYSFAESVYMINKITQDYLIRPMGIFQLIDYVGIDVCSYIMSVMNPYLPDEDLHSNLLDKMIEIGVKGGQNADGSQKNGFLKYEKGKVVAIYDINKKEYVAIEGLQQNCDSKLGDAPATVKPWKTVVGKPGMDDYFTSYFHEVKAASTMGAGIATTYFLRSKAIAEKLVADKVAFTAEDVNTVLKTGFFHAYGPINNFMN